MDMAYPAYDTYNNQVGFPLSRRPSMYSHPSEYAYDPALNAGVYGAEVRASRTIAPHYQLTYPLQNYPNASYPVYPPSRQLSQYTPAPGIYFFSIIVLFYQLLTYSCTQRRL